MAAQEQAVSRKAAEGWTTPGKVQGTLCKDDPAAGKVNTCDACAGTSAPRARCQYWTKTWSDHSGLGFPSWRSGSSRSSACSMQSWTGKDTVHTYTIHTYCVEFLTPTLTVSSTILALYTLCMKDKNAQAVFILFFPED